MLRFGACAGAFEQANASQVISWKFAYYKDLPLNFHLLLLSR